MANNTLEHLNITVTKPDSLAELLCRVFDWHIRWQGAAKDDGYTVHVGNESSYLALYTNKDLHRLEQSHSSISHLNHLGIVVKELAIIEQRILAEGYRTFNHGDYEPGKRFYFMIEDNIEIEVISYG